MSSRDKILHSVREGLKHQPKFKMPVLDEAVFTHYDKVLERFKIMLEASGAQHKEVSLGEIDKEIRESQSGAASVCNVSKYSEIRDVVLQEVQDPHDLKDVDIAVLDGSFGVAENGTIWVDYKPLKHRVIHTIVRHLVLVLPKKEIVSNMLEAYRRLPTIANGNRGCFICGPSKTADIERVLVLGAHGPHSLLVLLI